MMVRLDPSKERDDDDNQPDRGAMCHVDLESAGSQGLPVSVVNPMRHGIH